MESVHSAKTVVENSFSSASKTAIMHTIKDNVSMKNSNKENSNSIIHIEEKKS